MPLNAASKITQDQAISLYIHVPFCQTKCSYCDFNTYSGIENLIPSFLDALVQEIHLWGNTLNNPRVDTIFFGGGTPSYIPTGHIEHILKAIEEAFQVSPSAETTIEANPGDLIQERDPDFSRLKINRLSLGVQSLSDSLLYILDRRHSSKEAVQAYYAARQLGITNINIDLMYGLPWQTLDQWHDTLNETLVLSPEHLSLYCLTLEEGTLMNYQVKTGLLPEPDPDLAADMYNLAEKLLEENDYIHYEISNWSKLDHESLHNLTYWHNKPYLGIGPGAHSYLGTFRFHNIASPRDYITKTINRTTDSQESIGISYDSISNMPTVASIENIPQQLEMSETMMLGLRLSQGVNLQAFSERFGVTLQAVYGDQIEELISWGLLKEQDKSLTLTPRGKLLGNEVFLRFF